MTDVDTAPWWISFFQGPWGALRRTGYPDEKTRGLARATPTPEFAVIGDASYFIEQTEECVRVVRKFLEASR